MLDTVFLQVINMSFTSSFVIAFVILARLLIKRAPKRLSYVLWSVVLFRLFCPFSYESPLSLLPVNTGVFSAEVINSQSPQISSGLSAIDNVVNPALSSMSQNSSALQKWFAAAELIWIAGIIVLAGCSLISLLRLKQKLVGAVKHHDNIYFADHISTPFVIGIIHPKIYLPSFLSEHEQSYIILHEQTHIRRLDHIIKVAAFAVLAIHWFNPLVWAAYILFNKDMEMSCDESVMKRMDTDIRGEYSASLLGLATGRKIIVGTPLAFCEGETKGRIKNIMSYKKPALWVIVIVFIAITAICVGLAANPLKRNKTTDINFPAYQEGKTQYNAKIYEIDPFKLNIALPDGWSVKLPAIEDRKYSFGCTPVYLCEGEVHKATVCYNTFELYEGEIPEEQFYQTVYSQLRLGSLYSWQEYTPVATADNAETALATVYIVQLIEGKSAAECPQIRVPGILSYDKEMLVYVAIQFDEDAVTDEQLLSIAESIKLSR